MQVVLGIKSFSTDREGVEYICKNGKRNMARAHFLTRFNMNSEIILRGLEDQPGFNHQWA